MSERESKFREFKGVIGYIVSSLLVIYVVFHLAYTANVFLSMGIVILPLHMRAISLGFVLVLTFLLLPATKKRLPWLLWYDMVLILMSVASTMYSVCLSPMALEGKAFASNTDCLFAIFLFIPILEAMRRTGVMVVVIIGVLFILYAYNAEYFSGFLWGPGWGLRRLAAFLYMSIDGFYGVAMEVFSIILVPFLVFASFIRATGVGDFFMGISSALTGWMRGGPAKVSVLASAFFGTLSGSSIANVATTGVITIPLMKKIGFKPEVAGGVEASASTGGQVMPPVMGAAAFIMAGFLGVPYWNIVVAALIPSIFYFLFLLLSVDAESVRSNLKGLPRDQLPSAIRVLAEGWYCLVPIIGLVIALAFFHWRPERCALLGMVLAIVVSFARKKTMLGPRKLLRTIEEGARTTLSLGALCAGLGMIIGICGLTGLGINLSSVLIEISGNNLPILLVLTAGAAVILGMGMPTAGVYLFLAFLLAPALIILGVKPMAAHLFILYFGLAGLITPPVALSAYAAAPIAGASPYATGWQAMRLSLPLYIIPFLFVYHEGLLLNGGILEIITSIAITLVVTVAFVHGIAGSSFFRPLGWQNRIIFLVAGFLLLIPKNIKTIILGLSLFTAVFCFELWRAYQKSKRTIDFL